MRAIALPQRCSYRLSIKSNIAHAQPLMIGNIAYSAARIGKYAACCACFGIFEGVQNVQCCSDPVRQPHHIRATGHKPAWIVVDDGHRQK